MTITGGCCRSLNFADQRQNFTKILTYFLSIKRWCSWVLLCNAQTSIPCNQLGLPDLVFNLDLCQAVLKHFISTYPPGRPFCIAAISLRVSSEYRPMGELYCLLWGGLTAALLLGESASRGPGEAIQADLQPFSCNKWGVKSGGGKDAGKEENTENSG